MQIRLNGKPHEIDDQTSIYRLLADLDLPAEHVAVELNGELVERTAFERPLADQDRLEVVRFVGGG